MTMNIQFEIENVFKLYARNKICVFARLLNTNSDWKLTDEFKLGQVQIEKVVNLIC